MNLKQGQKFGQAPLCKELHSLYWVIRSDQMMMMIPELRHVPTILWWHTTMSSWVRTKKTLSVTALVLSRKSRTPPPHVGRFITPLCSANQVDIKESSLTCNLITKTSTSAAKQHVKTKWKRAVQTNQDETRPRGVSAKYVCGQRVWWKQHADNSSAWGGSFLLYCRKLRRRKWKCFPLNIIWFWRKTSCAQSRECDWKTDSDPPQMTSKTQTEAPGTDPTPPWPDLTRDVKPAAWAQQTEAAGRGWEIISQERKESELLQKVHYVRSRLIDKFWLAEAPNQSLVFSADQRN